ncbi:CheR family methyltransferase [Ilumatobacter sp.]|uniref:CheR family methyltransferase n=1 Tax=Ilumatobacter sp. TaxID=1967498 RepID=UPI003B516823
MSATASTFAATSDVDHFRQVVDRRIGVQLDGKEYLIENRLRAVAQNHGLDSTAAVLAAIRRGDRAVESDAIEAMTTNETSFFRDQHPFTSLAEHVLPPLAAANGDRLTIWNGACSSGQESYTLAMTIADHLPHLAVGGRTRIVSTDVSPAMVERTAAGTYSRFEVNRGLPAALAVRHFEQTGRNWTAKPLLRSMVEARELNLLEPFRGLPRCDVVLLRNVLIYFTVAARRDIVRRIGTEVLKPGGCLLLGASETINGFDEGFESRRIGSATFHYTRGKR